VIENAKIAFIQEILGESCKDNVPQPCKRFQVNLNLFLKGEEPFYKLIGKILTAFTVPDDDKNTNIEDSVRLKDKLQLDRPFVSVGILAVRSNAITQSPTGSPTQEDNKKDDDETFVDGDDDEDLDEPFGDGDGDEDLSTTGMRQILNLQCTTVETLDRTFFKCADKYSSSTWTITLALI